MSDYVKQRRRLGEILNSQDRSEDKQRPSSMDNRQCRLVLSLVNDVLSGRKLAVTFIKTHEGDLVEAGSKKVVEPKN